MITNNINNIVKIFPIYVYASISPYPTVDNVTITK